jgi:hypothetical protein
MPGAFCVAIVNMGVCFGSTRFIQSGGMLGRPLVVKAMPRPRRPQRLERQHNQQDHENKILQKYLRLELATCLITPLSAAGTVSRSASGRPPTLRGPFHYAQP